MTDRYTKSNETLARALKSIPLASQTFSKSITAFPQGASPLFIEKGLGANVWDIDGNEYIDFISALCSVTLGYCDQDIDKAVKEQLSKGVTFSLPHILETEVAEEIQRLVPCADLVRFGKNGTDATSAAIRLSRAYTGKDHIAVCGYHGWQDWYIGSTGRNLGVPHSTQELTHKFQYNNISSLEEILATKEVAAVILEPMNIEEPKDNFLEKVRELTKKYNSILIFDETITGFRYSLGGAQDFFGVTPDLATFGKGLANGYPLSAITGKREVMTLMEDIFFSGTFGGETLSLAASKAVLAKLQKDNVIEHLSNIGGYFRKGFYKLIKDLNIEDYFDLNGHLSWQFITFKNIGELDPFHIKTLYLQELFKRGIMVLTTFNFSYSHKEKEIDSLLGALAQVLPIVSKAIEEGAVSELLECEPLKPLFQVRN